MSERQFPPVDHLHYSISFNKIFYCKSRLFHGIHCADCLHGKRFTPKKSQQLCSNVKNFQLSSVCIFGKLPDWQTLPHNARGSTSKIIVECSRCYLRIRLFSSVTGVVVPLSHLCSETFLCSQTINTASQSPAASS